MDMTAETMAQFDKIVERARLVLQTERTLEGVATESGLVQALALLITQALMKRRMIYDDGTVLVSKESVNTDAELAAQAIEAYFARKDPKALLDMRLFALSFWFGRRSNTEVPLFRRNDGVVETYLILGNEKRTDGYANLWFTPGTHVGKTKEEAFKEIAGKAGINIGEYHEFQEFNDDAPDDPRGPMHRLVYPRLLSMEASTEGKAGRWIPVNELERLEMSPAHRRIIKRSLRFLNLV